MLGENMLEYISLPSLEETQETVENTEGGPVSWSGGLDTDFRELTLFPLQLLGTFWS